MWTSEVSEGQRQYVFLMLFYKKILAPLNEWEDFYSKTTILSFVISAYQLLP